MSPSLMHPDVLGGEEALPPRGSPIIEKSVSEKWLAAQRHIPGGRDQFR